MTIDLAKLRELNKRATAAPWYTLDPPWLPSGSETSILAESPDPHVARFICDFDLWALDDEADAERKSECPDQDAELIVFLRNHAADIILELADLRVSQRHLRRLLVRYGDRLALANNARADWQQEIDDAFIFAANNSERPK